MRTYEILSLVATAAVIMTTIVFITLKLVGIITWTWLWVFSPLGIFLAVCALMTIIGVIFTFLCDFFGW